MDKIDLLNLKALELGATDYEALSREGKLEALLSLLQKKYDKVGSMIQNALEELKGMSIPLEDTHNLANLEAAIQYLEQADD